MICSLPSLRFVLLLLATVVGLTAASPFTLLPGDVEFKTRCSDLLAETIQFICQGRTLSLGDAYPQSFGQRGKRSTTDQSEVFYRPLQNGPIHDCCRRPCGYTELRRYCAPD